MGLDETKALFDQIAKALEAQVPEGKESEYSSVDEATRDKVLALIPEETRKEAYEKAMALSDDDAYHCVRRVASRSGIRQAMTPVCFSYFSHAFWRELFLKANSSAAFAQAKKGGA